MIQVTTVKGTKLAIRVCDLISMESYGKKTMITIAGTPSKVLVLETFDEIKDLLLQNDSLVIPSELAKKLAES